jgi:prepilin-type N-terminal cleavage/methylation domain-containing protein
LNKIGNIIRSIYIVSKNIMKLSSAKRGFTLIELLVVIAIIGILSSVVLASLGTARLKARDATRISDLKNVQLALELYFDSNQSYPASSGNAQVTSLNGAVNAGGAGTFDGGPIELRPTYIPVIPEDPTQGNAGGLGYRYAGMDDGGNTECLQADTNNCLSYILAATLERFDNPVLDGDTDAAGATVAGIRTLGTACNSAADGTNGGTEQCLSYRP